MSALLLLREFMRVINNNMNITLTNKWLVPAIKIRIKCQHMSWPHYRDCIGQLYLHIRAKKVSGVIYTAQFCGVATTKAPSLVNCYRRVGTA